MKLYLKPMSLICWILVISSSVFAQKPKQIEIVNANTFEFDENVGNKAKRLLGEVVFKQDNVFMYCDSAYFYSDINSLDAYGRVHIKQGDSINAWGDMLNYRCILAY